MDKTNQSDETKMTMGQNLWDDIFEDTELSKLLLGFGRPVRLAAVARTSAIRFNRNGLWRQAFLNQLMKLAYYLHLPPDRLNRIYEKGLHLNKE